MHTRLMSLVLSLSNRDERPVLLGGAKPPRRDQCGPDPEILAYSARGFRILLSTATKLPSSSGAVGADSPPPPESFLYPQRSGKVGFAGSPRIKKQKSGTRLSFAIQYVSSVPKTVSFDFDVPRGET